MIIEKVRAEMLSSMKTGDVVKKNTLKMLIARIDSMAKDKKADLTEEEEVTAVQKELKQAQESLEATPKDRTELIEKYTQTIEVLSVYLPKQMDENAIRSEIEGVLKALGLTAPTSKDKGMIMKSLMPLVKGKADGTLVNKVVSTYFN